MSKRIVCDCDRCGKQNITPVNFGVLVDRKADAAGGMENEWEDCDVCTNCAANFIAVLLDTYLDYEQRRKWIVSNLPKRKK